MNYITLFSCAGIGCYGFKQEGFDCLATVEIESKRLNIQKHNKKCKKDSGYIDIDITTPEAHQRLAEELKNIKDLDLLVATPPCQGMSTLNAKKPDNDSKRNSLVVESIITVKKYQPKFFVFENVRAFLKTHCLDIDNKEKPISEAIDTNLSPTYNIETKIINFKEYGSNSSRTRTIVIGIRKDIQKKHNIDIEDIFPSKEDITTLKNAIGNLPSLKANEINKSDILHFSKNMNDKHFKWIENVKQGMSAFKNEDKLLRPHRILENGTYQEFNSNMGGKYSRQDYDKVAQCVHTYTGNPASQYTIHPIDTRVFSIKELMKMQSIPDSFKFSEIDYSELNSLSEEDKLKWIKKNEGIIRTVIGESVPTIIFQKIAKNIKKYL